MMMFIFLLISLIYTLVYTLSWVKFQKYQFLERDYNVVAKHSEYSRKWHFFKALNQSVFFYVLAIKFGYLVVLVDIIVYWILFDGCLNISVLKRHFFYVGTTSKIDKFIQYITHGIQIVYKGIPVTAVSAVIKLGLLVASIILIYKF